MAINHPTTSAPIVGANGILTQGWSQWIDNVSREVDPENSTTTEHNTLTGRDALDTHPSTSISHAGGTVSGALDNLTVSVNNALEVANTAEDKADNAINTVNGLSNTVDGLTNGLSLTNQNLDALAQEVDQIAADISTIPRNFTELNDVDETGIGTGDIYWNRVDGVLVPFKFKNMLDDGALMTGFINPTGITVSYDSTSRIATLTGDLRYYFRGVINELTSPYVSPAHAATTGVGYFLYDSGSGIAWSTTPWTYKDIQLCYVNYGATDKFAIRECHGLMPWDVHEEFHQIYGTYKLSGGTLTAGTYAIQPASPTNANNTPGVDLTVLKDEDLQSTLPLLADGGTYTRLYGNASNVAVFTTAQTTIIPIGTTYPQYNLNGVLTELATNNYMNLYLIGVPCTSDVGSQLYRYLWVPGSFKYTSLATALTETVSVNVGNFSTLLPEYDILQRITIGTSASYTSTGKFRIEAVTAISGSRVNPGVVGGSGSNDHSALSNRDIANQHVGSAISNIPAGGISATDVQSAINELDTEKAPKDSPTFTGTVSGITKTMVGLGNVDNTSDVNKPVSTATQTALNLKANIASPTFTGTVSGITKAMVGLGNVDNTSDANKPISTATQTALNGKQNLDANLTSIAALSDSGTGLVRFTSGIASLDTNTYLTANQSISLSGDSAGSGTTSISTTNWLIRVATPVDNNSESPLVIISSVNGNAASSDYLYRKTTLTFNTSTNTLSATAFKENGTLLSAKYQAAGVVPAHSNATASVVGIATAGLFGHVRASGTTPLVAGTANIGVDNGYFAREGHVHPAQTTITGNAGTATKLATAVGINGVAFDGSGPITITAVPTNNGFYVQGVNNTRTTLSTDFNALVSSGFYSGASASGSPATGWHHLVNTKYSGDTANNWQFQLAAGFGAGSSPLGPEGYYVRIQEDTTWKAWRKLYHDGEAIVSTFDATIKSITFADHPTLKLTSSSPGAGFYSVNVDGGIRPVTTAREFLGDSTHTWKRANIDTLYTERCNLINYTANTTYSAFYGVDVAPNNYNFGALIHRSGAVNYLNGTTSAILSHGGSGTALVNRVVADAAGVTLYGGVSDTSKERVAATGTGVSLYAGTSVTAIKRVGVEVASVQVFSSNGSASRIYADDTQVILYAGATAADSVAKFRINNTGVGFQGSAPSGKPAWTAWTGTAQRGAQATDTVTLINLARAFKALTDDLRTYGLIT